MMAIRLFYLTFILFAQNTFCGTNNNKEIYSFKEQHLEKAAFLPLRTFNGKEAPGAFTLVRIFYESQNPECRKFFTKYVSELVQKLGNDVRIRFYPFGRSTMSINYDLKISYKCGNGGEPECYANKLHACVNYLMMHHLLALNFNICLMEYAMPNDTVIEECGEKLNVTKPRIQELKECPDLHGKSWLLPYAFASFQVGYRFLPYVEINNLQWAGKPENLIRDVCAAMRNRPEACKDFQHT